MSETSRHARTSNTGTWEAFQPPRPQGRGRQSQGRSRAEDARLEGVGLGHSSEETGEQSSGCAVAESAERRAGRNGSSQQAKHGPDTEPDFPRHRRLRDTAVPKGCRHDRSEEPGALAGTPGSARGASGNRRPTATVQRYHYLGYRQPLSTHLRYFLRDRQGRLLGCLLFDFAARDLACRDQRIGWQGRAHRKHLHRVLRNSRYLLLPWVRVKNLASHAWGLALRQLPADWRQRHGHWPVLCETYVDPQRHRGTCYQASNWERVGQTRGRKAQGDQPAKSPKDVYLYPLRENWQQVLCDGPAAGSRPSPAPSRQARPQPQADERFTALWQEILEAVVQLAHEHDALWMRRRRVLNTLLC